MSALLFYHTNLVFCMGTLLVCHFVITVEKDPWHCWFVWLCYDVVMCWLLADDGQDLQLAAEELIGQSVFVGWPHLYEALIESVATDEMRWVFSVVKTLLTETRGLAALGLCHPNLIRCVSIELVHLQCNPCFDCHHFFSKMWSYGVLQHYVLSILC